MRIPGPSAAVAVREAFRVMTAGVKLPLAEGIKLAREKAESPLALPLSQLGSSLAGMGSGVAGVVRKGIDTSVRM